MKTKTVGEMLRDERQRHRFSLEDLSQKTRIRVEYLEALEKSKFGKLPAATFVKGYIKAYGRVFGLDHQPLLALLRRDYKESAKGKLVPREFLRPVLGKRRVWTPVTITLMIIVGVFCTLLGYVGVQWYELHKPPELLITQPEEGVPVAPQVVIQGNTDPEAVVVVNNQPVALQPDGSFRTEVFLPREGINTITIEATDRKGKSSLLQKTVRVEY